MPAQTPEIYIVIIIGAVLSLLLVGFIVAILFLYQHKQHVQERQLALLKNHYEGELLRTQLEIQESTLEMIAQELHDNIGQVLSVVKLSLSVIPLDKLHPAYESISNSRELLGKVILDLSDLSKSLHTERIIEIGLLNAIRYDLEILRKTGLLEIDFSASGKEYFLGEQKTLFIFRIYQELMNNILKHAKANRVSIRLDYLEEKHFELKLEDDGIGFDVSKTLSEISSTRGLGLKNLQNRARLIGAHLSISSRTGKGTAAILILPVNSGKSQPDYEA